MSKVHLDLYVIVANTISQHCMKSWNINQSKKSTLTTSRTKSGWDFQYICLFAIILETKRYYHGSPLSCWILHEIYAEWVPCARRLPRWLGVDCTSYVREHNSRVPPGDVELCPHSLLLLPGMRCQKIEIKILLDNFSSSDANMKHGKVWIKSSCSSYHS